MQLDSARSRSPCCLKTTCVPELEKSGVSATGASWISKSWLLKFRPWPVSLFSSGMYFCNKSGTSSTCPNTFRIKKCRVEGFTVYSFLQWQPLPLPSKPGGVVCPASRGKSSSLLTTFSCWSSKDVLNVEKKKHEKQWSVNCFKLTVFILQTRTLICRLSSPEFSFI